MNFIVQLLWTFLPLQIPHHAFFQRGMSHYAPMCYSWWSIQNLSRWELKRGHWGLKGNLCCGGGVKSFLSFFFLGGGRKRNSYFFQGKIEPLNSPPCINHTGWHYSLPYLQIHTAILCPMGNSEKNMSLSALLTQHSDICLFDRLPLLVWL